MSKPPALAPSGCIGPFQSAFDCPVHNPRKLGMPPAPAATAETCAKCGCPQTEHHACEPGPHPGSAESYCGACGAEDCWHFTDYKPAPEGAAEAKELLDKSDHDLSLALEQIAALRSQVETLVAALERVQDLSVCAGPPHALCVHCTAATAVYAASALAAHGEKP